MICPIDLSVKDMPVHICGKLLHECPLQLTGCPLYKTLSLLWLKISVLSVCEISRRDFIDKFLFRVILFIEFLEKFSEVLFLSSPIFKLK